MTKQLLFLISFWFFLSSIDAQTISGTIKNTKGEPLPYATCYLMKNHVGASTNDDGKYQIVLPVNSSIRIDTLLVSYIGYKEDKVPVYFSGKKVEKNLVLKTTNINLEEVVIFEKKPLTPEQIVKKTIKQVKKNYSREEMLMDGFYRETMKEDAHWIQMNEAVVKMKYTKYPQRINSNKRMKAYYDDGYLWSYRGSSFIFRYSQFWPYYIDKGDQMEIVSSRLSFNQAKSKLQLSPKGGPIDVISLDKIKYFYDFLDPKNLKYYSFKTKGRQVVNNEKCYVIDFRPILNYNKRIYRAFNKRMKQPILVGRMYVSMESFALVKYEAQLASQANFTAYDMWKVFPFQINIEANYNQLSSGKWMIKSLVSKQVLLYENSTLKCVRELSFNKYSSPENVTIDPAKQIRITKSSNLYDFPDDYDENFWKVYEKTENYPPIPEEIKLDLERQTPLEKQYQYINLTIDQLVAPVPKKEPFEVQLPFDTLVDDYHWLTNKDSITEDYIYQENKYKNDVLRKIRQYNKEYQLSYRYMFVEDTTKKSKITWINNEKCSWTQDEDGDRKLFKLLADSSKQELFNLDFAIRNGAKYTIDKLRMTNKNVLYSYPLDGMVSKNLIIKPRGNNHFIDSIPNIDNFFLYNDSMVIYTALDSVMRPDKLLMHHLGEDIKNDSVLYWEKDPQHDIMNSRKSYSKEKFFIEIASKAENEIRVFDLKTYPPKPILIKKRKDNVNYQIEHYEGEELYFKSNHLIAKFSTNNLDPSKWESLYKSKNNIQEFSLTKDFLVVKEQEKLEMNLKYIHLKSKKVRKFDFNDEFYAFDFKKSKNDSLNTFQIYYQTPILPECIQEINLDSSIVKTVKVYNIFHDFYNLDNYKTEILWAKAEDGTKIPIEVFYNKFQIKKKLNGIVLHGYGMYGGSYESRFSQDAVIYANQGFIVAWALVRGGADLGEKWHEEGKLLNKKNTFTDYIVCAEFLQEKYKVTPHQMAGGGLSAGGLIMGYVANNRPDLFNTLIFDRPWLDPFTTMSNPSLPLTVDHYKEVGNPQKKEVFDYMKSYSPYQNITKQEYPNMMFITGYLDVNAPFWQVMESVSTYREKNTSNSLILSDTGMNRSHYFNYSESLASKAEQYAFIMYNILGMKKESKKVENSTNHQPR